MPPTNNKTTAPATRRSYRRGIGVMLFNDDGLIFAGKRRHAKNPWQMPQGGIEKNEPPEAAMLRELYEETGIRSKHITIVTDSSRWLSYDLPRLVQTKFWRGRYVGQKQKWFLCHFKGGDKDIDTTKNPPIEFVGWQWLPMTEIVSRVVYFKRDLYEEVARVFTPAIKKFLANQKHHS